MSILASIQAGALYLLPVAALLLARANGRRGDRDHALTIVLAIAVDLLSLLALAFVVRLETAAIISRAVWLVAGAWLLLRRREVVLSALRQAKLARCVGPFLMMVAGVGISMKVSAYCAIWDHEWHVPLVASLRGQQLPFNNVYELGGGLYYHYAGDVLGAVFQTLSLLELHASSALSRLHDVHFGLIGLVLALLLRSAGVLRLPSLLGFGVATFLCGPVTLFSAPLHEPIAGFSTVSLLSLSFRPHAALAFLLVLGFIGASFFPSSQERVSAPWRLSTIFCCVAALTLTDELSLAILGMTLGAVWLFHPEVLHASRVRGALALGGMAGTIPTVIALFGGTFAPGGHIPGVTFNPGMFPLFSGSSLPLFSQRALGFFVNDYWAVIFVWSAGLVTLLATRRLATIVPFLTYSALAVGSFLGLISFTRMGDGQEAHRFVTVLLLSTPLFGALWFQQARTARRASCASAFVAVAAGVALIPAATSGMQWAVRMSDGLCAPRHSFWNSERFATTSCRRDMGARLGEVSRPIYAAAEAWYGVAGCRAAFVPGPDPVPGSHAMSIGNPLSGLAAVRKVSLWVSADEVVSAYCPRTSADVICRRLRQARTCTAATESLEQCSLSGDLRREWVGP